MFPTLGSRHAMLGSMLAIGLLWGTTACERPQQQAPSDPSSAKQPAPTAEESAEDKQTSSNEQSNSKWRAIEKETLEKSDRQSLETARTAQKELGKTLKSELLNAVSEKSFSGAVDFCHSRAPEIAQKVAQKHDVHIGRTSHRLRNPDNAPPAWTREAVRRKEAREYVFEGPNNQVGFLKPIKLKGMCSNCHGPTDKLAPGVSDQLDEHYPEDEATGFEVGDLRGWFWVEAPGT